MKEYIPIFRRRRMGLTDYRARKKAIISGKPLLVVRISTKSALVQFIKPKVGGDTVLSSCSSKELIKFGWNGSLKSTPACYLLGLLAGKRAMERGLKEAILYNGIIPFVNGSRIAALVKGVNDSGLSVPISSDVYPSDDRITGRTIASYALSLMKKDKELYQARFSRLLRNGFKPEDYPSVFESVRESIMGK